MTADEKVELAEKIASHLRDASRNDWQKWVNYYAQTHDLQRAVNLARRQSRSVSLRPNLQKAAGNIASVVGSQFINHLSKLPPEELEEVFGYVGRCLKIAESARQQQRQERRPAQQQRRPPERRGRR